MSPYMLLQIWKGVELGIDKIELPKSEKTIVVEGAGGVMVPFNSKATYLDLMVKLNLPVVLVTRHYLGVSITLAQLESAEEAGLNVVALVISGKAHESTENHFATQMDVPFIRINELEEVNSEAIAAEAERLQSQILTLL